MKKLSVGSASFEALQEWQNSRVAANMPLMHVTRNRPRRADEILAGGSIYWIIKGVMCARQPIIELREVTRADGRPACGIVLAPDLVKVEPTRMRIFQGWRYLDEQNAPRDVLVSEEDGQEMPLALVAELRELGLL
jgi:hypothetical protein